MSQLWTAVGRVATGRRAGLALVVGFLILSGGLFALPVQPTSTSPLVSSLPSDVGSARAAQLARTMPGAATSTAVVVLSRDGAPLTTADRTAAQTLAAELAASADSRGPVPTVPATDGAALLLPVTVLPPTDESSASTIVSGLRSTVAAAALPPGLIAQVSGGPAVAADISASFEGADTRLLLATALIVALLLLVTYRSPVLWIVPLLVVGAADQLGGRVTQLISAATGLPIDGSSAGIASVLVFGAGTNYALLLIARYREELRGVRDTREAMRRALRSGGPAIAGSALTVTLALLTLSVAVTGTTRTVGWTSAVGIVVVLLAALLVLPAALVVCGRGVFWPFVPRMGSADPARAGVWSRVGAGVVARPLQVTIGSILLLVVLAAGLIGTRIGLATTEQFRTQSESAAGLETIAAHFPGGEADPVVIVANADRAGQVLRQAQAVPGVSSVTRTDGSATLVRLDAVLAAGPGTPASFESVRGLRAALSGIDGADAVVGGSVAEALDARDAATRDFLVIAPLILLVVALVLVAVLRSLVAPLLIVPTVVLSYLAALGLGSWMSSNVFGFPALDVNVPLFAFLFLVALGVDYNIFLTSRAREESARDGTQRGIVTAVAVTGSVITSAGVLLASVFAVLGVLPLITLTQVGIIVGLGVLLDTFVVRTLLVPALVGLVGRRFWWPREVDPDPLPYRGDRNPPTDLPDLAAPAEVRL